jgi:predicted ATPase/DNA-binding XRE family transcriptional regulator
MQMTEPDAGEHAAFGVLLKRYRVAAGLSQEALAERARLSVRAVSAYERGERQAPYRDTVALLVQALDISPEEAATLDAAVPRRRGPEATPGAGETAASATRAPETPPTNLPMQLTSFVGRRNELAEVLGLLEQSRLLTLIGAGGAGKTRLALRAAGAAPDRYPDGVWLVELAPLTDAMAVPRAVAAALGIGEDSDEHPVTRLQGTVRSRALLLVLDNCEHLLDACAGLADALLRAGPRVRILATSREALGIAGESSWRVPSLALPEDAPPASSDALLSSDAVQLFVERARAALPHFALTARNAQAVAQVCRRLDGLPLAIELAAARVRGLAVEQLAARLDQRFQLLTGGSRTALARQQTLRATVDWSYGLLDPDERRLFDRLSVFAGGFTLEWAESVCAGDGLVEDEVLDVLLRLVDKSLVAAEEGEGGELRYRLLETLRAYGQERLAAGGGTAALQARHARYYLALAERAERGMRGPGMTRWLDRLDPEYANLTAALDWSLPIARSPSDIDPGDATIGLRLSGALWLFWFLRGHRWAGMQWMERALARAPEATPARAKALRNARHLSNEVGDYGRTLALLEEGLTLSRLVDERADLADTLCEAGACTRGEQVGFDIGHRGDYERGSALLAEGLALARGGRPLADHVVPALGCGYHRPASGGGARARAGDRRGGVAAGARGGGPPRGVLCATSPGLHGAGRGRLCARPRGVLRHAGRHARPGRPRGDSGEPQAPGRYGPRGGRSGRGQGGLRGEPGDVPRARLRSRMAGARALPAGRGRAGAGRPLPCPRASGREPAHGARAGGAWRTASRPGAGGVGGRGGRRGAG